MTRVVKVVISVMTYSSKDSKTAIKINAKQTIIFPFSLCYKTMHFALALYVSLMLINIQARIFSIFDSLAIQDKYEMKDLEDARVITHLQKYRYDV